MDINHRSLTMPNKFFDRNWWKDFVVAILAIYRCPAVG